MLGSTAVVSRRTGGLLSSGGDELGDGLMEQLGLLALHPVAALRDGSDGQGRGEGGGLVGPVGGAVPEVYLRGLAAGADKLLGQGELVEEHVPDLAVAVRRHETAGYAGIGRVGEHEPVHELRGVANEGPGANGHTG